jgi:hypothetical protein
MKKGMGMGKLSMKVVHVFLVLFILQNNLGYCQQDTIQNKVKFIIKADVFFPIVIALNEIADPFNIPIIGSLTLESCFSNRHSLQLTGFIEKDDKNSPADFQIMSEYKYYLMKRKPYCGFYTGGCLKYIQNRNFIWTWTPTEYYSYDLSIGEDVIIGYQNLIGKHFVYDILFGLGRSQLVYWTEYYKPYEDNLYDFRLAINVGYKF